MLQDSLLSQPRPPSRAPGAPLSEASQSLSLIMHGFMMQKDTAHTYPERGDQAEGGVSLCGGGGGGLDAGVPLGEHGLVLEREDVLCGGRKV